MVHVLEELVLEPAGPSQLLDRAGQRLVEAGVRDQERGRVGEGSHGVHFLVSESSFAVQGHSHADRSILRLQGGEDAGLRRADDLLERLVGIRIVGEVVCGVDVPAAEDHARDRPPLDGDLQFLGHFLGEIPAGPGRLEAVRIGVVNEEDHPLGPCKGRARFGAACQHLAQVRRPVGRSQERVQAAKRFDAALDAPAHPLEGRSEPPELIGRLRRRQLHGSPFPDVLRRLDERLDRRGDPARQEPDYDQNGRKQIEEEKQQVAPEDAVALRLSLLKGFILELADRIGREPHQDDPARRRDLGRSKSMLPPPEDVLAGGPGRAEDRLREGLPLGVGRVGERFVRVAAPFQNGRGVGRHQDGAPVSFERAPEITLQVARLPRLREEAAGVDPERDTCDQLSRVVPHGHEKPDLPALGIHARARRGRHPDRPVARRRMNLGELCQSVEFPALQGASGLEDRLVEVDPRAAAHRPGGRPDADVADRGPPIAHIREEPGNAGQPLGVPAGPRVSGARSLQEPERVDLRHPVPDVAVLVGSGKRRRRCPRPAEQYLNDFCQGPADLFRRLGPTFRPLRAVDGVLLHADRGLGDLDGGKVLGRAFLDVRQAPGEDDHEDRRRNERSQEKGEKEARRHAAARVESSRHLLQCLHGTVR